MSGKSIFVTGGNGGIGQYVARYLLAQGERNIVLHYRSSNDRVLGLLREFDLDPNKHAVQADLVDEEAVARIAIDLKDRFGGVDRLVNVAGSSSNSMSWKLPAAEFIRILNDNLVTSFICCKAFIPGMRESGFGRIVNFSSIVGFTGMPGTAHYAAAKAGMGGLTKSLALELASKNITVNAIAPGYFNAGLIESVPPDLREEIKSRIPMRRFGGEQDIGALVAYLTSREAGFLTGQVLHVNGGQF